MDDKQKYDNFTRVKRHIAMLETTPLTEDKLQQYKSFFRRLRDAFPNLTIVNMENQDVDLRQAAVQGETYMQILEYEFDPNVYLQLLHKILFIVNRLVADDELAVMMGSMGF